MLGLRWLLWLCAVTIHVYLIACSPPEGARLRVKLGWIAAVLAASIVGLAGVFVVR